MNSLVKVLTSHQPVAKRLTSIFLRASCVALVLTSCVSNEAYHEYLVPGSPEGTPKLESFFPMILCHNQYTQKDISKPFSLGFIEFDDQGEMFDPQELRTALDYIQANRHNNLVLITYINGWQNNASIDGACHILSDPKTEAALATFVQNPIGDVQKFKQFLALVANTPCVVATGKHVVGVYLGWRGELYKQEPFHTGSYPSRHSAATRMGDASDIAMALMAIQESARGRWVKDGEAISSDEPITVVMGHSFGGKILEQALCQWLTREYAFVMIDKNASTRKDIIVPKFADLVLFMNPASEAIYARRLTRLLQPFGPSFGTSSDTPSPAFVAVGSETDSANGTAFPIGADIVDAAERLSGSYRTYPDGSNQWKYVQSTAPNTPALVNGLVKLKTGYEAGTSNRGTMTLSAQNDAVIDALSVFDKNLSKSDFDHDPNSQATDNNEKLDVALLNGKRAFVYLTSANGGSGTPNTTRYWILRVTKDLMDGHGDVWNPNAMCLYARLLRLAAPERFAINASDTSVVSPGNNQSLHLRPLSDLN